MHDSETLTNLLSNRTVWRGYDRYTTQKTLSTGHHELDILLKGGWPEGALIEMICHQEGIGELRLLTPILADHTQAERICILLNPPYQPYAPSWAEANIDLRHVLIVRSRKHNEWLWAAETAIRGGALLLAWVNQHIPNYSDLRKLKLAAAGNNQSIFLFNKLDSLSLSSPASLRLEISSSTLHELTITVCKSKGGHVGEKLNIRQMETHAQRIPFNQWIVPICHPVAKKDFSYKYSDDIVSSINT